MVVQSNRPAKRVNVVTKPVVKDVEYHCPACNAYTRDTKCVCGKELDEKHLTKT